MPRTERSFFLGDAVTMARMLPGMDIVIGSGDHCGRYMITETEAYFGEEDRACHASKGRTGRTEVMYLKGGHLYIYLIYGIYWMMNIVTGEADEPQAVLIRGVASVSGPGRVTRALGINGSYNREDLTVSSRIWLEETDRRPVLKALPRVGIGYAGEPWVNMPWRFIIEDK